MFTFHGSGCRRRRDASLKTTPSIRLADPCGLLRRDGVSKRFIPIGTVADAQRPALTALIRAAAALDPAEWASSQ